MALAKEAEALAFAEPLVPKRYHTWLRILTQWKNDKERNGDPDPAGRDEVLLPVLHH